MHCAEGDGMSLSCSGDGVSAAFASAARTHSHSSWTRSTSGVLDAQVGRFEQLLIEPSASDDGVPGESGGGVGVSISQAVNVK